MEDLKFDLQLFAEPSADNTPVEQPEMDSTGQEPQQVPQQEQQNDDFDWSIDEDTGDVTFDPSIFDDNDSDDSEGGEQQPEEPEEQPTPQEPQKFAVKINGVEQYVTLDELQRGYMQQADLTK
jgi:hypothetical protein